jgi:hypothetical protein
VNKIISVPSRSIVNIAVTPEESRIQAQRSQEISILLASLTAREEVTIKLIIDCLYDIGYVNIINKKVRYRSLNAIAKFVAKTSKPIARILAWRWFKKNCPQLITNWLSNKVKF